MTEYFTNLMPLLNDDYFCVFVPSHTDDEFMANELAALTEGAAEGASAAGIPATSADLEGDAATLKAAAAKAEAAGEYRRAAEILMKSGVTVDAAALKMKAEVDTL